MTSAQTISSTRCFNGTQLVCEHHSEVCDSKMRFAVFLPSAADTRRVPVVYWLSGLTCTEENFTVKAGAQRYAEELGVAIVAPDTSPRNTGIPGEDDDWDFGSGAGFYVNATAAPWSRHYHMYDYVVSELPALVETQFNVDPERRSVMGHSMGGHGALVTALRNPGCYKSVSAFAPICAPTKCLWGLKAMRGYLGEEPSAWKEYDTCSLIRGGVEKIPLFVDQGDADPFLEEQLKPEELQQACEATNHPLRLRMQPGYDHSYFFIASFIREHLQYHAEQLSP
ncbi:MAG: S-formylglutathione hydrolase [Gammaproteobacteria bacterium]|nr:S-formylglutathione hydrolase [Gammaproteobacteria bacterium]